MVLSVTAGACNWPCNRISHVKIAKARPGLFQLHVGADQRLYQVKLSDFSSLLLSLGILKRDVLRKKAFS